MSNNAFHSPLIAELIVGLIALIVDSYNITLFLFLFGKYTKK